jgi:hypothetical protein
MALLTDLIGSFVLGILDGALKKWLAPYVASGKLAQSDADAIVNGVNADVKLGLIIEQAQPGASSPS